VDTATQALLGAAVGQVACGHRLGRRALAWGAVAGLLPDLDVVAVATHGPFGEFLYHRGPTHALWFGPVVGPLLGWAVWRLYAARLRRRRAPEVRRDGLPDPGDRRLLSAWALLFVLALFTHPLLDVFTAYGTQLLAPFSLRRFAWNGVAIIDPLYSLPLLVAVVIGARASVSAATGRRVAGAALALTTLYLGYGFLLNERAERSVAARLAAEGVHVEELRAYPTILQPWLRRVVARTEEEVRVGLHTSWRPDHVVWESFPSPPPHPLVARLRDTWEGSVFVWFAMGQVHPRVLEARGGTVVEIDDLRYGFPGEPDRGLWGIRAFFDRAGRLRGGVQRFNRRRNGAGPSLGDLWRATWGDFSDFELPGAPS